MGRGHSRLAANARKPGYWPLRVPPNKEALKISISDRNIAKLAGCAWLMHNPEVTRLTEARCATVQMRIVDVMWALRKMTLLGHAHPADK